MRKWILAGLLGLVFAGSAEAGPFGLLGRHRHRGGECCHQQQASQSWGYQATSGCSSCSGCAALPQTGGDCFACSPAMPVQNWQQPQTWQQPALQRAVPAPLPQAPGG